MSPLSSSAWLLIALLACESPERGIRLVSETPLPDPQALRCESEWLLFGTGAEPFLLRGDALEPGALAPERLELDYGDWPHRVHQVWGFVAQRTPDGSLHGYGTLHLGQYRTVIAHFTPLDEEECELRRWRMTRLVLGDVERRDWDVYEAKLVAEPDGTLYLVHVAREGEDRNVIQAQRMLDPEHADVDAPPRVLLRPEGLRSEDRNGPGGLQLVEGTSLTRVGEWWVLLYSVGDYLLPNYKLGVAYSRDLLPEEGKSYQKVKREGGDVSYLLQSEDPERANYCGDDVVGPGLGSLLQLEGEPWLLFHGYRAGDSHRQPDQRFVWRVPLEVDFCGEKPTPQWLRPRL